METSSPYQRIAIFGPGLLGGSLVLACRERLPAVQLRVWARREEAVSALSGLADFVSTDAGAVAAEADLAVLCVPVEHMAALAGEIAEHLPGDALVTDVGSVKMPVLDQVAPLVRRKAHFIGSHPMAGSEQAGFEAARADLFEGAVCLVTSDGETPDFHLQNLTAFWRTMGCQISAMSAAEHDATVAWVSHLPHLLAVALVNIVAERAAGALPLCGPGFRDTTRVAAGPAEMWTGIFAQNREALRDSTEAMIEKLREFATLLDGRDMTGVRERLSAAKTVRDRMKKH